MLPFETIRGTRQLEQKRRTYTWLRPLHHELTAELPDEAPRDGESEPGAVSGPAGGEAGLEEDGYVARERIGRRNRYSVLAGQPLRHPLEAGHTIEEIIETVNRGTPSPS